jgi:integrase
VAGKSQVGTSHSDEILRLADEIEPRFRAAILTQGFMGLRAGELFGLTTDSVNLLKGTLTVSHSLQEDRGHLRLKSTKTEA